MTLKTLKDLTAMDASCKECDLQDGQGGYFPDENHDPIWSIDIKDLREEATNWIKEMNRVGGYTKQTFWWIKHFFLTSRRMI